MKIESNQINNTFTNIQNNKTEDEKNSSSSKKSDTTSEIVYAGDLNLNSNNIDGKKLQAQKKALKTILDQFKNENRSDKNVSELKDKQNELFKDMDTNISAIRDMKQSKQELKDAYGITDDSIEQKDLEQVEQKNMGLYVKSILQPDKMSEAENTKLQNVLDSLTDYQKEAFRYDTMDYILQKRVNSETDSILSINQALSGIKLEKLKVHPMLDAQKQAAGIIKNAGEEVIGAIMQQVKDKVDDTVEQNIEKAEKAQKEQDKKDKKAEESKKENKANSTANTNDTAPSTDTTNTAIDQADQQHIIDSFRRAADKQKMLNDDIKGIVVDEQI